MRRTHFLALLGLSLFLTATPLWAAPQVALLKTKRLPLATSNGYTVQQQLDRELMTADLGVLAKNALQGSVPKTPEDWLRQLAILLRADYRDDTLALLRHRPAFLTRDKDWGLRQLGQGLGNELLISLCELFPEQTILSSLGDPRFQAWIKATPPEAVEKWLALRIKEAPEVWMPLYIRYRQSRGTAGPLIDALKAQVIANPESYEAAENYLTFARTEDTTWVASVCRPKLAVQNYQIAVFLSDTKARIPLLERALAIPFTEEDVAWNQAFLERNPFSYHIPGVKIPSSTLRLQAENALVFAYREAGQAEKAQSLEAQTTKTTLNPAPQPAPKVETKETAAYWLAKGKEHLGRKEYDESKKAFERALELAPPTKEDLNERNLIVDSYFWVIYQSTESILAAKKLYRQELDKVPLTGASSRGLIHLLADRERFATRAEDRLITPDDPLYLSFLESEDWRYGTSENLLICLLQNTPSDASRKKLLEALGVLVRKSPETRAGILGEALFASNDKAQAIVWLEEAYRLSPKESLPYGIVQHLWMLYLENNDWKKAEAIQAMYSSGVPNVNSYLELATAAARAGDPKEALRFYRRFINFDRRNIGPVPAFVERGMQSELGQLYKQLAQKEPRSYTLQRLAGR